MRRDSGSAPYRRDSIRDRRRLPVAASRGIRALPPATKTANALSILSPPA
jgi:hypothetical protein